jgi:hypothetical protein
MPEMTALLINESEVWIWRTQPRSSPRQACCLMPAAFGT